MKYLITFFGFFLLLSCQAQTTFSRWYSFSDRYGQVGLSLATDGESRVFINTTLFCYRPGEEVESFPCSATMRTDLAGELIAVDTFEYNLATGRYGSFFWKDSLLYGMGHILYQQPPDSQMLVRAFNRDMEVVYHNNIDSGSQDEDISFLAPYGDGFVATSVKGYQTCDQCDTARVVFLDRELHYLREFNVHQEGPEPDIFGVHNLVLSDGTLIGTDIGCGLAALCGAVTRFDTTGQILWQKPLDRTGEHSDFFVPKLAPLPDDNFVVSWISNHDPFPSTLGAVATFFGMSPQGDTLWTLQFADDDYQEIQVYDLEPLANGDVLGVGVRRIIDPSHPTEWDQFRGCGYICRISPTGELLWEKTICDFVDNNPFDHQSAALYSAVELPDGGLILSGHISVPQVADSTRSTTAIWLVRTDSMGCVTPGCSEGDILNSTEVVPESSTENILTTWPNPATDQITLQLSSERTERSFEWRVFDLHGRSHFSTTLQAGAMLQISIEDWPPGLYSWQLWQNGQLLQIGRQVKL